MSVREREREWERILLMVDVCVYNGNNVERERVRDRNGDYNLYSFPSIATLQTLSPPPPNTHQYTGKHCYYASMYIYLPSCCDYTSYTSVTNVDCVVCTLVHYCQRNVYYVTTKCTFPQAPRAMYTLHAVYYWFRWFVMLL